MPEIDWIAVLTAVLVVVTGYYAWQTRETVKEMQAARGASIQPRLVTRWTVVGPMSAHPRIENVGAGPALEVDVEMSFEPGHGLARRWKTAVLSPGEGAEFLVRNKAGKAEWNIGAHTDQFESIRLAGTYRDAFGTVHAVDDLMEIRETWELAKASGQRLPPDHTRKAVDLLERIARSLQAIESRAQRQEWREREAEATNAEVAHPGESTPSGEREPKAT